MGAVCSSDSGAEDPTVAFAGSTYNPDITYLQRSGADAVKLIPTPGTVVPSAADINAATQPLSELTAGQLISLQGRAGVFNTAPPLDDAWLCGALSEAEWKADIESVNAAALAEAKAKFNRPGGTDGCLPDLLNGRELIAFTTEKSAVVTAHRVFVWLEDGVMNNTSSQGVLFWNHSKAERVKQRGNSLLLWDVGLFGVSEGKDTNSAQLRSAAARPFPSNVCFSLRYDALRPSPANFSLNLAAPSSAVRDAWLGAFRMAHLSQQLRRTQRREADKASLQRQLDVAAERVRRLNARYEQAGRGEAVKWFFQKSTTGHGAYLGDCQLMLRCRPVATRAVVVAVAVAVAEDAPPAYDAAFAPAAAAAIPADVLAAAAADGVNAIHYQ